MKLKKDLLNQLKFILDTFFKIYKIDRNSETEVGQWAGKTKANKILQDAHQRWRRQGGDDKIYWQMIDRWNKSEQHGKS